VTLVSVLDSNCAKKCDIIDFRSKHTKNTAVLGPMLPRAELPSGHADGRARAGGRPACGRGADVVEKWLRGRDYGTTPLHVLVACHRYPLTRPTGASLIGGGGHRLGGSGRRTGCPHRRFRAAGCSTGAPWPSVAGAELTGNGSGATHWLGLFRDAFAAENPHIFGR